MVYSRVDLTPARHATSLLALRAGLAPLLGKERGTRKDMTKKITNKQYAQALFDVTKDLKDEKIAEAIKKFVLLLARQHKLKRAEKIIAEYEKCVKRESGEVEIVIKSARKLEKTLLKKVEDIFGPKVKTREEVDENLLGGIVVKTEDKILDGSLKTQINQLKQSLA